VKRLGTDYIDIYHMHTFDALTPVEEVLYTLNDLVHSGKVRYIASISHAGTIPRENGHAVPGALSMPDRFVPESAKGLMLLMLKVATFTKSPFRPRSCWFAATNPSTHPASRCTKAQQPLRIDPRRLMSKLLYVLNVRPRINSGIAVGAAFTA